MNKYNQPWARQIHLFSASVISSLLFCSPAISKEEDPLFIGGTQYSSSSSFTYAGLIVPIWGGKLGQGWFSSTIASWLSYDYDSTLNGRDVNVKAKAPGIETGLGCAWKGDSYGVSLSASAGYRHYRISPQIPDSNPEGGVFTVSPQIQARYDFTPAWDTNLIASHTFGQKSAESSFNRLRLGYKPKWDWKIGPEVIVQEGENYRVKQYGLYVNKITQAGYNLEISGGTAKSKDDTSSAYIGLAVSKQF